VIGLGLLGLVVAYYKDGSNSNFNRYMGSNSFGPSFILTALATVVSLGFNTIQEGEEKSWHGALQQKD
jgi:hypothetical protein